MKRQLSLSELAISYQTVKDAKAESAVSAGQIVELMKAVHEEACVEPLRSQSLPTMPSRNYLIVPNSTKLSGGLAGKLLSQK